MLKKNGYDDSHIILIIDKALASDAKNPEPGVVRSEDNGENLYNNVIVDYDNASLTLADINNILLGAKTDKTPVVLPKDAGQNVFLFWSGHGHNRASNGADELVWRDAETGRGLTAELLPNRWSDAGRRLLPQDARHHRTLFLRGSHHIFGWYSWHIGYVECRHLRAVVCRQLEFRTRRVALRPLQP